MRLVPDQTPKEVERKVARHLKSLAPKAVKVSVQAIHGAVPWIAATDHPALEAAGRAMRKAFGRYPVFVREGGSIPIVPVFERALGAPVVLMGFGLPDDNLHAPNEKMELEQFWKGIEASAYLMHELGTSSAPRARNRSRR